VAGGNVSGFQFREEKMSGEICPGECPAPVYDPLTIMNLL